MKTYCKFMENKIYKNFDTNFGILRFDINEEEILKQKIDWVFTIDISGSMDELASDNKKKIYHIKHTITNMINYFLQLKNVISTITILIFDNITEVLCYKSLINKKFLNEFKFIIKLIEPRKRLTNIEHALKVSNYNLHKIKEEQEKEKEKDKEGKNYKLIHIFMTDGEITMGETNIDVLKSKLYLDSNNIFIGYGYSKYLKLLEELSDGNNNEFYFIDDLKNAGLVYGEIIYNIVYECIRNLEISIKNGSIYDYTDNLWKDKLLVSYLTYGKVRTFHIKHNIYMNNSCDTIITDTLNNEDNNNKFNIYCKYYDIKSKSNNEYLINNIYYPEKGKIDIEVEQYLWRQIIQVSMYTVKKIILEKNRLMKINYNEILNDYIKEFNNYMYLNNLHQESYICNLYDDLYTALTSLNLRHGYIFINTRIFSQGEERAYNIKNLNKLNSDLIYNKTLEIMKDISINSINSNNSFNTCNSMSSLGSFSSYASNSQINLMRSLTTNSI